MLTYSWWRNRLRILRRNIVWRRGWRYCTDVWSDGTNLKIKMKKCTKYWNNFHSVLPKISEPFPSFSIVVLSLQSSVLFVQILLLHIMVNLPLWMNFCFFGNWIIYRRITQSQRSEQAFHFSHFESAGQPSSGASHYLMTTRLQVDGALL